MRVLIADDDPVSLRLLGGALDHLRHEVLVAHDGREAWEVYENADVPLVITDWMMPRMSGIELCQAIRAEARDKYCYVVIVTTLSAEEHTLEGFRVGADDYLVKPVRVDDLKRRIAVAERVRQGMTAKIELTLRTAVEMCQAGDEHRGEALLLTVKSLADFYRTERAYTKARAFLRRQINLINGGNGDPGELPRLTSELRELEGLEDART